MKIKLRKDNKWVIDIFKDGKRIHSTIIPPKDIGERIDFIDRRWEYHYGYTGSVSHGILITIRDSEPILEYIPENTLTRLRRLL